ncbi:MAG: hypothetical protein JXB29_10520 [Sedimentisphaerales bacterium]|nr:hypothetical protein [Sedimentisphaerales bacterium]
MGISFHCKYCGKAIEAPDEAGGKWAKCPACHNKIYVPKIIKGEELKISPLDESEQEREKRLMAETHKLTQDILLEKDIPEESDNTENIQTQGPTGQITDSKLEGNIILCLRQMAEGDMDRADKTANLIIPFAGRAIEILDRIALSDIPEPALAEFSQQVLSGLIRKLRSKIG